VPSWNGSCWTEGSSAQAARASQTVTESRVAEFGGIAVSRALAAGDHFRIDAPS